MTIFVTGATGYLGNKLVHALADRSNVVHALVRNSDDVSLTHANIKLFKGDIRDSRSINRAMKGCTQVYHAAAHVRLWEKDPAVIYDVNVTGTENILKACIQNQVDKMVFTSTCGVIGPSDNTPSNENKKRSVDFKIDYDITKKSAEDLVVAYSKKGLQALIVSPSKIYGPGNVSHSLTANAIIEKFLTKKIALVPLPGTYQVCFAYLDDVVQGHILAMEKGRSGEKYILGGINISYLDFFSKIRELSGCKGKIYEIPKSIIKAWASLQELNQKITNRPIRFTSKSVDHLFSNYTFTSDKAIAELGYNVTPLDIALKNTVQFLNKKRNE